MKSTGIVRRVDELGRIVIPKEIRKKMDITSENLMEIYVDGDKIILTKDVSACCFCGSREDIVEFKGRNICGACVGELRSDK